MNEPEIPTDATLHLYAQGAWHDEAYIVGTREGLRRLAVALQELASDMEFEETPQASVSFFTADGEGYDCHLLCETEAGMERYRLPYTEDIARNRLGDEQHHWPRPPHGDGSRCECEPQTAEWAQWHGTLTP